MTEQEKAFGRKMIVGVLGTMIVVLCLAIVWHKLNEPMEPIVVEFADRYYVRWGNRFQPFAYESLEMGDCTVEYVHLQSGTYRRVDAGCESEDGTIYRKVGRQGWEPIDELPPDAYRRMFEGQILIDAHLNPERLNKI